MSLYLLDYYVRFTVDVRSLPPRVRATVLSFSFVDSCSYATTVGLARVSLQCFFVVLHSVSVYFSGILSTGWVAWGGGSIMDGVVPAARLGFGVLDDFFIYRWLGCRRNDGYGGCYSAG